MVTKSAREFWNSPAPGVKKSLFNPEKKVIESTIKHTPMYKLQEGNRNANIYNAESVIGKYHSLKSPVRTAHEFEGMFGTGRYRKSKGII